MLDDIILFTELVEHQSYTKAAAYLNMSQSTLSKRINNLEQHLKLNLVVHHTRKFEITADGEVIYQKFKHLRQYLKENIDILYKRTQTYKNSLNICVSTSLGYSAICPYLDEFTKQNPDISLNIFFRHSEINDEIDFFDIVITNYITKKDNSECMLIGSEIAHLFCTPRYKEKYGIPEHIHELEQHRFIGVMNNAPLSVPKIITFRNRYHNYEYIYNNNTPQIRTNLPAHMKKIGMIGDYIFMNWKSSCQKELDDGSLIHILNDYDALQTDFYLTVNSNYSTTEKKFIDFIRSCINRAY